VGTDVQAHFRSGMSEQPVAARAEQEWDVFVRPRVVHTGCIQVDQVNLLTKQVRPFEALACATEVLAGCNMQGDASPASSIFFEQAESRKRIPQMRDEMVLALKAQIHLPVRRKPRCKSV
jgi:hypothetical protein